MTFVGVMNDVTWFARHVIYVCQPIIWCDKLWAWVRDRKRR
jgi:hypothetical protein